MPSAKDFASLEIWGREGGPTGFNCTEALEGVSMSKLGIVSLKLPAYRLRMRPVARLNTDGLEGRDVVLRGEEAEEGTFNIIEGRRVTVSPLRRDDVVDR